MFRLQEEIPERNQFSRYDGEEVRQARLAFNKFPDAHMYTQYPLSDFDGGKIGIAPTIISEKLHKILSAHNTQNYLKFSKYPLIVKDKVQIVYGYNNFKTSVFDLLDKQTSRTIFTWREKNLSSKERIEQIRMERKRIAPPRKPIECTLAEIKKVLNSPPEKILTASLARSPKFKCFESAPDIFDFVTLYVKEHVHAELTKANLTGFSAFETEEYYEAKRKFHCDGDRSAMYSLYNPDKRMKNHEYVVIQRGLRSNEVHQKLKSKATSPSRPKVRLMPMGDINITGGITLSKKNL